MLLSLAMLVLPTIWIVDAANGPGTNFTDLPAAVAAAAHGDTILVRAGAYSAFQVSGKALAIRGESGFASFVRATAAAQPTVIDAVQPARCSASMGSPSCTTRRSVGSRGS